MWHSQRDNCGISTTSAESNYFTACGIFSYKWAIEAKIATITTIAKTGNAVVASVC